jgi:hypothetical protein
LPVHRVPADAQLLRVHPDGRNDSACWLWPFCACTAVKSAQYPFDAFPNIGPGPLLVPDASKIFLLFRRNPVDSVVIRQRNSAKKQVLTALSRVNKMGRREHDGVSHAGCEKLYPGAMG